MLFQSFLIPHQPGPVAGNRFLLITEKRDLSVSLFDKIRGKFSGSFPVLKTDIVIISFSAVHKNQRFRRPLTEGFTSFRITSKNNASFHIVGGKFFQKFILTVNCAAHHISSGFFQFFLYGFQKLCTKRICINMLSFSEKEFHNHQL